MSKVQKMIESAMKEADIAKHLLEWGGAEGGEDTSPEAVGAPGLSPEVMGKPPMGDTKVEPTTGGMSSGSPFDEDEDDEDKEGKEDKDSEEDKEGEKGEAGEVVTKKIALVGNPEQLKEIESIIGLIASGSKEEGSSQITINFSGGKVSAVDMGQEDGDESGEYENITAPKKDKIEFSV